MPERGGEGGRGGGSRASITRIWSQIWNLLYKCDILHCLSQDLPVFDEMCKRCLMLIDTCLHHNGIVRFFAWHGIKCIPCTGILFISDVV